MRGCPHPFGRYGGALSGERTAVLGAMPSKALMERKSGVDFAAVTDVLYGCANQAGEAGLMIPGGVESMSRAPFVKVLAQTDLTIKQMDVVERNEAFGTQGRAVLSALGLKDDDVRVNAYGGAIALGHPLGVGGARLATTAVNRLQSTGGRYALCTICIREKAGHCLDPKARVSQGSKLGQTLAPARVRIGAVPTMPSVRCRSPPYFSPE